MSFNFEGEYVKSKRTGIVREYYTKGNITFENEFLNERKTGENNAYRYLIFEGEYENNCRDKG